MAQERLQQRGCKLYRRLSNSLNNSEKGWCKPRVMFSLKHNRDSLGACMSSSQYWLPGFCVSIYKLFKMLEVSELKPTGRGVPLMSPMLESLFIHSLQPTLKSCGKPNNRKIAQSFRRGTELLYFYSLPATDFCFKKACSLLCKKYSWREYES